MKRRRGKSKPIAGETRTLKGEFPGATRWGIVAPVDGSWAQAEDWVCPSCDSLGRLCHRSEELVVWEGDQIINRECFNCWHRQATQLSLLAHYPETEAMLEQYNSGYGYHQNRTGETRVRR